MYGVERKTFCDETTDFIEINEVGKFDAITEGAAGGDYRIAEVKCADIEAKIDDSCESHIADYTTGRGAEDNSRWWNLCRLSVCFSGELKRLGHSAEERECAMSTEIARRAREPDVADGRRRWRE